MKKFTYIAALFFVVALSAQEAKPTFTKDGDKVIATYFHENGEIAQTGEFLKGKLHGEWTMFDEAGTKIASGEYISGKKTGKWFFWKGEEFKEVDFEDSRIVGVTKHDANGAVVIK
ncbi:MAG: nicotinic acid mononucleotide adenyltransferase [Cellulophaga sp.]|nr:nicotinic acid mononucleotide adenyltransferase [Cellulophaga sp.]